MAGLLELGNDEVYYWTYAIAPDWNHFDHPPMVGWMIQLTTLNLHWVSEISLRLGPIIGAGMGSWLLFKTAQIMASEKVAFYTALVYQFSVYTGVIAGLFILPDAPQMPLWTASLYVMAKILFQKDAAQKTYNWLVLGALIGLSILCKVHGLYLWAGFGLSMLLLRPKWLLEWRLYIAVATTSIFIIPIVYWNIQYDFITYRFHADRVTHTSLQWDMLLREVLGELGYQNPVIFILIIVALIAFLKKRIRFEKKEVAIWLFCMSVPMILLFWGISLFNPTLPHWTGPAYIPLYFYAGLFIANNGFQEKKIWIKIAGTLLYMLLMASVVVVRFSAVNYGSQEKENFGEYCPTLDLSGWKDFSEKFAALRLSDQANGQMKTNASLVVSKWFPGGHIEYYISRTTGIQLIGLGKLNDLHKFVWLNQMRRKLAIGDDAYCVVPSNLPFDIKNEYGSYFTTIEPPVIINQVRNGAVVRYFKVYRLKSCKLLPMDPI